MAGCDYANAEEFLFIESNEETDRCDYRRIDVFHHFQPVLLSGGGRIDRRHAWTYLQPRGMSNNMGPDCPLHSLCPGDLLRDWSVKRI